MPFTGIVEEMGVVASLKEVPNLRMWDGTESAGFILTVAPQRVGTVLKKKYQHLGGDAGSNSDPKIYRKLMLEEPDCYIGCSIAVNGVCLTVRSFDPEDDETFAFGLAPETLKRTNLGDLSPGDPVNLERAQKVGGRNSGHYVQGHVDQVGTLVSKRMEGDMMVVKIALPRSLVRYVCEKGYIAIDGTSVTVVEVDRRACWFSVMLIAHTQNCIILPKLPLGGKVNLEVDVMSKYLENAAVEAEMNDLRSRVRVCEVGLVVTSVLLAGLIIPKYFNR